VTAYLDSSVLVAALVEDEPAHAACLTLVRDVGGVTWLHALAEVYSALTGGRLGLRVAPALAAVLITEELAPRLQLVDLPAGDAATSMAEAAAVGARGGAVYDWLHLCAARRAGAQVIHTLDARDFAALARPGDPRIEQAGAPG
jgi:predicted nucleic acid-binding protein